MLPTPAAPGSIAVKLAPAPIRIDRWPTERPLFAAAAVASALLWLVAAITVIGLFYALFLGSFFFIMHLVFIAQVRGSGVRLGPEQFPELYERVESLALRMGMERVPETYLMQAGGSLNAFATRFLGTNIVVLFSDLLEACGGNEPARDMIIAHELGHVHAGHLRWHWFLLPSKLVPFLGSALSRSREYTCDRYGLAGAGDREGAVLGMTILAAGGTHGPKVNREALVRQRAAIDTGWMTIGEWLSSHPPLVKRILQLDPTLGGAQAGSRAGGLRALGIVGVVLIPLVVGSWLAMAILPGWMSALNEQTAAMSMLTTEEATSEAWRNMQAMTDFVSAEQLAGRALPESAGEVYERWEAAHPGQDAPLDPFDGGLLGYVRTAEGFLFWSSGPDGLPGTGDDMSLEL